MPGEAQAEYKYPTVAHLHVCTVHMIMIESHVSRCSPELLSCPGGEAGTCAN